MKLERVPDRGRRRVRRRLRHASSCRSRARRRSAAARPREALAAGVPPREVWLALCEATDVPAERRHGAGRPDAGATRAAASRCPMASPSEDVFDTRARLRTFVRTLA